MKRLIATLLMFMLFQATPALAQWTKVAPTLNESIVRIETGDGGTCSGFVSDNEKDLVVTAAHCDGPKLYVDQIPATIHAKDLKSDLMVLYVRGIDKPALKMALKNPEVGQEVATYGFGLSLE